MYLYECVHLWLCNSGKKEGALTGVTKPGLKSPFPASWLCDFPPASSPLWTSVVEFHITLRYYFTIYSNVFHFSSLVLITVSFP